MDTTFIALKPVDNLDQRLRAIISFKILSDHLNIPLYVYWSDDENNKSVPSWNNLFKNTELFTEIDEITWNEYRNTGLNIDENYNYFYQEGIETKISLHNIYQGQYSKITAITSKELGNVTESLVNYVENYDESYLNYFNQLEPVDNIEASINSYVNTLPDNTIGVYIKRNNLENNPYRHFYYETDDNYFDNVINNALENVNRIFLVSDSDEYLEKYNNENITRFKLNTFTDFVIAMWILRSLNDVYVNSYTSLGRYSNHKITEKTVTITGKSNIINYLLNNFKISQV